MLERVTTFKVIKHIRPKIVCRSCEAIVQAPMPCQSIARGRPGPGLLAHVLVSKYADHGPLSGPQKLALPPVQPKAASAPQAFMP